MSVDIKHKNPNAVQDLLKGWKKLTEQEIAVGFPKGMTESYPDGTRVLDVAIENCYGTPTIPQRDFMSLADKGVKSGTKPIMKKIGQLANTQQPGLGSEKKIIALQNAAGMVAQEAIREAIIELDTPPNAPATIEAKGSSNPLIDTGKMKDSVTWAVRPKRRK